MVEDTQKLEIKSLRSFICESDGTTTISAKQDYTSLVLDLGEGKRIAKALGNHKAVILRNHGLLTVGHTVDSAAWWFITLERVCQAQLIAESVGKPILIPEDIAEMTRRQVGGEQAGWFSFQPLWDLIIKEQPDLLD